MENFEGIVISDPLPNQDEFSFTVNKGTISKGEYVMVATPEKLIARVINVQTANRYYERMDSVHQIERSGVSIEDRFPVKEWEFMIATAKALGIYEEKLLRRVNRPPSPGMRVRIADGESLKVFLGFDQNGIELGKLESQELTVKINLTRMLQKHLAILSLSGGGKSYCASVLLEELMERKREEGRVGILLIDVHGEYVGFAEKPKEGKDYSRQVEVVDASKMRFAASTLTAEDYSEYLSRVSPIQKRELARVLNDVYHEHKQGGGLYSVGDVIGRIEADSGIKANTKQPLLAWLYELDQYNLFSKVGEPNIYDLIQPGKLAIIDMSRILNMRKKQIILTYLGRKLFNERRNGRICPFVVFIEEAHNFAREGVSQEYAVSRAVIESIAREGRKFGVSLCLITQRPIQLSTTALSQCNTNIILRVTNPYDLQHIGQSSEGIDKSSLDTITSLRVGEALIVGEAVNYPIFLKVRKRKSADLKTGLSLEELAKNYETGREKVNEDVDAFM